MTSDPHKVGDILEALEALGSEHKDVAVADVVACFGQRSYGPFLLVPALIGLSPIGAIPGAPTTLATILGLFAVQIVLGRKPLWLPGMLGRRKVSGKKLVGAARKLEGLGKWMDRWFHGRLTWLIHPPAPRIAGSLVLLICIAIPPLELLPLAVFLPMSVIAATGIALLVHDGALMLAALLGTAASFYLIGNALI